MYPNTIVVGGGIGGLAIAAALARNGTAVTLLEQAPAITEVGAGLQITPNAMPILRRLGLEAQLARTAQQAQRVVLEDDRGRDVARLPLDPAPKMAYHFVHRADLIDMLAQAARRNNVTMELGRRVSDVIPGDLPRVILADGSQRQAKLVICADGLHSVGRRVLNGGAKPQFTGQVAWRAVVPLDKMPAKEVRVGMGAGRHIVRYPLRDGHLMNLVAVEERAEWAEEGWNHRDDPANLRAAFSGFTGPVADLLEKVQTVHLWGLFRHPVAGTWVKDGVALLGDAAHPTLPFLAQGANMALEDAAALLHAIDQQDLRRYETIRKPRATRVINAATGNAWKYHLRPGATRFAAHTGLRLLSKTAPGLLTRQFDWLYKYDIDAASRR